MKSLNEAISGRSFKKHCYAGHIKDKKYASQYTGLKLKDSENKQVVTHTDTLR